MNNKFSYHVNLHIRKLFSGFSVAIISCIIAISSAKAETVYMIQLGSFDSEQKAKTHWDKIQKKFPDVFNPLAYRPAEVSLPPDNFVYHRTQAGPIENKATAESICGDLLVSGFECYVVETALFEPDVKAIDIDKSNNIKPSEVVKEEAVKAVETKVAANEEDDAFSVLDGAVSDAKTPAKSANSAKFVADENLVLKELEESLNEDIAAPAITSNIPVVPVVAAAAAVVKPVVAKAKAEPVAAVAKSSVKVNKTALKSLSSPDKLTPINDDNKVNGGVVKNITNAKPAKIDNTPEFIKRQNSQAQVPATQTNASEIVVVNPWQKQLTKVTVPDAKGLPFQSVESKDHLAANNSETPWINAVKTPVKEANVSQANLPELVGSKSANAQIKVSEAVRVPLSVDPTRQTAPVATPISRYKASPSQSIKRSSLWAELKYFSSQKAAINYWNKLQIRNPKLPADVRLRVTKPFKNKRSAGNKLSLRVGPFKNVSAIRSLCRHTQPEKLRCRAVKDLGTSIASGLKRRRVTSAERKSMRKSRSIIGNPKGYWLQLGSYATMGAAQNSWNEMSGKHKKLLSGVKEYISLPRNSSMGSPKYRLRVGSFASSIDAVNLCHDLKNFGEKCIVVSGR